MLQADAAIVALARRQRGLVTRRQALEAGLASDKIMHRVASGRWRAVRRGVIEINGVPPTWEEEVLAACLAAGPGVYASHPHRGTPVESAAAAPW